MKELVDELIINHRINEEVKIDSDSADFLYLSQVCPNDPGQLLSFFSPVPITEAVYLWDLLDLHTNSP